jgi:hypothetical protein
VRSGAETAGLDPAATTRSGRQLGLLWGGVAVTLIVASPLGARLAAALPGCRFKQWLGIPCPTCGTTRAALALARLDLVEAFVHYPLATVAWILLVGGGMVAGVAALAGYGVPEMPRRIPVTVRIALVVVLLANWAYLIATGV